MNPNVSPSKKKLHIYEQGFLPFYIMKISFRLSHTTKIKMKNLKTPQ